MGHEPVTPRDEAHGSQDLQDGSLGLQVLRAEALGDGVDPGGVGQHVGSSRLQHKDDNQK